MEILSQGLLNCLDKLFSFPSIKIMHLCFYFYSDSGEVMIKICNIMPQDSGIYSCLAVNEIGSASSSATIKVQGDKIFSNHVL